MMSLLLSSWTSNFSTNRIWNKSITRALCIIYYTCIIYILSLLLKELEHRILGWKVLILKYDLGKSLNKEMWCKMADTKKFLDYIFKKMINAFYMRNIFFVSMDKKMISPHNEWYIGNVLVCAHFSSKQARGTYCLCSIMQLFRLLGIV